MRNHRNGLLAHLACLLATLSCFYFPGTAAADEAGTSFWLPGQYGSFAAVPSDPGWSFESAFYHASADASGGISFERGGAIQAGMKSPSDFFMFTPTYAFETRIFGAQAAFGTTILYGKNATSVSATLTGPGGNTLSGSKSDDVLGFGDIYLHGLCDHRHTSRCLSTDQIIGSWMDWEGDGTGGNCAGPSARSCTRSSPSPQQLGGGREGRKRPQGTFGVLCRGTKSPQGTSSRSLESIVEGGRDDNGHANRAGKR